MSSTTYGEAITDTSTKLGRAYADTKAQREAVIGAWIAKGFTREQAYGIALFGHNPADIVKGA